MPFESQITHSFEIRQTPSVGAGGRTVAYWVAVATLTGADRRQSQTWILSAGLSAYELTLAPLGVSAPVAELLLLSDQPLDVRLGVSTAAIISAVRMLQLAAQVSSIFVTTPSNTSAKVLMEAVGGSAAGISVSLPLS